MGLQVLPTDLLTILLDLQVILAGHLLVRLEARQTLADQEAGTNEEITCSSWNDPTPHRLRF